MWRTSGGRAFMRTEPLCPATRGGKFACFACHRLKSLSRALGFKLRPRIGQARGDALAVLKRGLQFRDGIVTLAGEGADVQFGPSGAAPVARGEGDEIKVS